ncbi:hypothetical protein [Methylobacterium sp. A54F]
MFRSGFILGMSGPAAILTILIHPMVQQTADHWSPATAIERPAAVVEAAPLPGMRPASLALSPVRVATAPRVDRPAPAATRAPAAEPTDKAQMKPRRTVREGCEAAVSSLAGPEARRMTPGRCIA